MERLWDSEFDLYKKSFDLAERYIAILDQYMCVKLMNESLLNLIHRNQEECYGRPYWELPLWEENPDLQNQMVFAYEKVCMGEDVKFQAYHIDKNHELRCIEFSFKALMKEEEKVKSLIAIGYDITDIQRAHSQVEDVEQQLNMFFNTAVDGYFIKKVDKNVPIDPDQYERAFDTVYFEERLIRYNESLGMILEITSLEFEQGRVLLKEKFGLDIEKIKKYWIIMIKTGHVRFEMSFITEDMKQRYVEMTMSCMIEKDEYAGCFGTVKNITKNKENEHRLFLLANYDSLTQVPNRRYFIDCLEKVFDKDTLQKTTFVMFDIDKFKRVNDTYGHAVGDTVIREVAKTISEEIGDNGIFARMGGEEFAAIMYFDLQGAEDVVADILEKIRQLEIKKEDKGIKVTISAGIVGVAKGENFDSFYKKADTALYQAKELGRDRYFILKR